MIMAVSAMESVRVEESDSCGRKLVATSGFTPGQCILEESPYVYTLLDNKRRLYCDFCLKKCSTRRLICSRCKYVWYCSASCQTEDWARCHKQDCKILKIKNRLPGANGGYPHFSQLLSNIIQKQRRSPPCTQDYEDCFPTTVDQLESHHEKLSDARRDEFDKLLFVLKHIYTGELGDDLPESSSLLKMLGAAACNAFSIMDNDLIGIAVGIYLRASLLNHSCDPNCVWVFDGRQLQIRTVKDVKEEEECTISYLDVIHPARQRQTDLKERYQFTCECLKCIEETNALEPDDGSGELELRDRLKESLKQIEGSVESHNWAKVLQQCEPYLKLKDSSSSLPTNHYLLVKLRDMAMEACIHMKTWEKALEMGELNIVSYRYHYGEYNPNVGTLLLKIGEVLCHLKRLQKARIYVEEAESVLKVTHGPHHSLVASVKKLLEL